MALHVTIREPGKHWSNAAVVALTVLLSPLLIVFGLMVMLVMWPIRKLFPPKPLSAKSMIDELDRMLHGPTDYDIDYGLQVIARCDFNSMQLEQLKQRVLRVGPPPWTAEAIDELKAVRDSARALFAGDAQ